MRLIDADKLPEHKFTRESAKGSDYMRGWNDAIDTIVDNEPTVITNSVYEAYCAITDEEFEHSDSFWITTPKGKKINFVKERPQGEQAERALAIIDRLHTDGHINNKEQGSLRRAILLPERPQGEWIDIDSRVNKAICSNCKGTTLTEPYGKSNFCPNCGADMRGGRK